MKINLKPTTLGVFSALEFLGIMGFLAILIYGILQSEQLINSYGSLMNSVSMMGWSLFLYLVGMFVSNPKQDRLDKDQMDEWSRDRKKELIAWREAHPMVA